MALENVTIDARAIGSHIFEGCGRLIKPHITGTLDHIPDAAFQKSGIRSIDFIPQSVTAIWAGAFTESQLEGDLVLPLRFAVIVNGAFSLTNIRSVTVPEGFRELRDGVFAGCRSLSKVSLPSTLKYLGGMEFSATAIKQIDIPRSVSFLQLFTARFSPSFKSIGQVRTFYFPRYGIETHIPSGFHQEHRERLFHVL